MLMIRGIRLSPLERLLGFSILMYGVVAAPGVHASPQQSKLLQAKSSEDQGLYEEAIKQYQAILKGTSPSPQARMGLGRSWAGLGRCDQAADAMRGLADNRAAAEAVVGICNFRVHDFGPAITHLEQSVRLAPADKESRIYLSRAYVARGRYNEAIATLKSWLARNGDDVDVLYWTGKFYEDLASTTFQKMAENHPDSYLVLELEGEQYVDKKEYKKALEAFDRAMTLAPDAKGLHYWRGYVYWYQRNLYKAQEELETELRSNPYHAQANYLLGDIHVTLREPDKAFPFLERAVALNPGIWDAHRSLGRALVMNNRIREALREFQIVAKANPNDDTIHGLLSNAYRRLGDMEKAVEEGKLYEKLNAARRERVPKPSVDNPAEPGPPE